MPGLKRDTGYGRGKGARHPKGTEIRDETRFEDESRN